MNFLLFLLLAALLWAISEVTGVNAFIHHRRLLSQYAGETRTKAVAVLRGRKGEHLNIEPIPGRGRKWRLTQSGQEVTSDQIATISTRGFLTGHTSF